MPTFSNIFVTSGGRLHGGGGVLIGRLMAYKKILVDNLTCKRRFHIAFDDEDKKTPLVEIRCMHCDAVVFRQENHAPAKLARDEVLIKLTDLSPIRTKECFFQDQFSPTPKPKV